MNTDWPESYETGKEFDGIQEWTSDEAERSDNDRD